MFLIVEGLLGDLEIGAGGATKEVIEPSVLAEDMPITAVSGKVIKPEIVVRDESFTILSWWILLRLSMRQQS